MNCIVSKLHSSLKDFSPRGGASAVEVNNKILVFGGADREQTHFQDLMVYSGDSASHFSAVKASGDIPMPRSGHAVVAFGKYMLLFGGIDFAEEAVFNDLYILDSDTYEWGYVGESGLEVTARNSHSLGIVGGGTQNQYIVIYGGASPEHGPLGDTIYAELPDLASLDLNAFHVTWLQLPSATDSAAAAPETVFAKAAGVASTQPGSREMHGTCCFGGSMYISGGRNVEGHILSDVWSLSVAPSTAATTDTVDSTTVAPSEAADVGAAPAAPVSTAALVWRRCPELELPTPRCAHGAVVVVCDTVAANSAAAAAVTKESAPDSSEAPIVPSASVQPSMLLIGGFTGAGISSDAILRPLSGGTSQWWSTLKLSMPIGGRFGLSVCALTASTISNLATTKKYAPVFSNKAKENFAKIAGRQSGDGAAHNAAVFLFGGVCIEQDFGDIYLLTL